MSKKSVVSTAVCLTATMMLGSMQTAFAATPLTLAGAGLQKASSPVVKETEAPQTEAAQTEAPQSEAQTERQTEAAIDRSMVDTTGFAKAEDYINVRASGDAQDAVVGTLPNNASVYIEDVDDNGWYKVRSGNVEGFVAGYLIATGQEAQEIAKTAGYTTAQVGAQALNVRTNPSEDSDVVTTVGESERLEVVEDLGDWVKVCLDSDTYGYVSTAYVNTTTEYATGETIQEQSEREEAAYLAAVAEQEAAAAAAAEAAAWQAPASEQAEQSTASEQVTDSTGTSQVEALYQAYLKAQEEAMHPVDAADAEEKANAAIDAYNAYLAACGSTQTVANVTVAEETTAEETAASAEETTVEETTASAEETVQTEAPQTEAPQTEAASSGSSLGAQIASYATQFVGNPYVYGGASLTGGADCSGFTMAVMAHFGIGLPHNAAAQSGCGTPVSLSDLQPGDLLFYDNGGGIGHVTLYIGGGQVVHASNEQTGIKISAYNYRNPVAAVRCW